MKSCAGGSVDEELTDVSFFVCGFWNASYRELESVDLFRGGWVRRVDRRRCGPPQAAGSAKFVAADIEDSKAAHTPPSASSCDFSITAYEGLSPVVHHAAEKTTHIRA